MTDGCDSGWQKRDRGEDAFAVKVTFLIWTLSPSLDFRKEIKSKQQKKINSFFFLSFFISVT